MKIKSYFSRSVQDAMATRDDAMLVNSSRTAPESRHLGEYEVVFAVNTPATAPAAARAIAAAAVPNPEPYLAAILIRNRWCRHP